MIHREPSEAAEIAGRLRDRGIEASAYQSLGARGFRQIRTEAPELILIDLVRLPSYGKALGVLLRENKALRSIPLVFLAGDPKKTAEVRRILPDAGFASWSDLPSAIARAIERPPAAPRSPRAPARSVAQKLGIEPNSTLAFWHAPEGFALPLPPNVRLVEAGKEADVILVWVRTEAALDRNLPALARLMSKGRRVWLLWPKRTSGIETTLTMPRVRELATGYHLIDYKVCAVDTTWSAMAVGPRRR